jgi:hypothetical protein
MCDFETSIWDTLDFGSAESAEADELRSALSADEAEISEIRARQVERLRRADRLQLDTADGSRIMADWVVANLDVSPQTARRMMRIARAHHRDIEQRMAAGEFGIDRAAFLCQIRDLGGPEELIADSDRYSLGHLYGVIDRLRKIDSLTEQMMFEDRYMALQPSLDRSSGRFWGQTHGTDWHIIEKALTHRESQLPALEDQTQGQRRVDALASLCMDSLTTTGDGSDAGRAVTVAEVFVDAALAAPSFGEAGVTLSSGPRVGPNTLSEILCTGKVRVIVCGDDGRPIGVSDLGETIPPAVRSFVLQRDHGRCQIDGCQSRYRIQPHHTKPRAWGGDHDPGNLVCLCWYHHHVAIHQMGMTLDPSSPPHRRRLKGPYPHGPPNRAFSDGEVGASSQSS